MADSNGGVGAACSPKAVSMNGSPFSQIKKSNDRASFQRALTYEKLLCATYTVLKTVKG